MSIRSNRFWIALIIGNLISLWWGGGDVKAQWKTYRDKDYKYEIKYPENFSVRRSSFPVQENKLTIVRFLAPEDLQLENTAFRSSFLSIRAKRIAPESSLEDYLKNKYRNLFSEITPGFKASSRSEAEEKFQGLSYFNKIAIGRKGISGYLLHFWGRTGVSYIFIKHSDTLIEISSNAVWREGNEIREHDHTFFLEHPIARKMLESYDFFEQDIIEKPLFALDYEIVKTAPLHNIDEGIKRIIEREAPKYWNPNWRISRSQFKAWILMIALLESNARYGAHSQGAWGTGGRDLFHHRNRGSSFRFSTGIGLFQLDRGQPDSYHTWPTINKLDPDKSVRSVCKWFQERFKNETATLERFHTVARTVWFALGNREEELIAWWPLITGFAWSVCRTTERDVGFNPRTHRAWDSLTGVYGATVEYKGLVFWNFFNRYKDTYLITANRSYGTPHQRYYYTYCQTTNREIWVFKDATLRDIFTRNYRLTSNSQWPEGISACGRYAGSRLDPPALPALDLNRRKSPFAIGNQVQSITDLLAVRNGPFGSLLGNRERGDIGRITDGPQPGTGGLTWWRVDFNEGVDGWVPQNWLKRIMNGVVVPTPQVTGVEPAQPVVQPGRQPFAILGSGFVNESTVIIRSPDGTPFPIPRSDNPFIRRIPPNRIEVEAGFASAGTWSAQVVNPGDRRSNIFSFSVVAPAQPPAIAVTPASLDFGNVTIGTTADRNFTVTNTGGGTLTGTASVPSPFSIVGAATYSLSAGASATVTVRFTPTAPGLVSTSATFTGGGGATRAVSGTGVAPVAPPAIAVGPASIDFGNVTIGTARDLSFTVTNTGGGTLTGTASVPAPFSIVGAATYSLTAGASATVTVRFTPTAPGLVSTSATFTGGGGATRAVSGTGVAPVAPPAIAVGPASIDFGNVTIGTARDLSFTVTNTGGGTLTGSASVPAPFSIVGAATYSLTAGASATVTVRFTPTAAGLVSTSASFTGGGGATRAVSGTGVAPVAPPAIAVGPSSIDFGNVTIGTARDLSFTVTNTGGGTLTGSASVPAPFSIIGAATYSLTAGASATVTVRFTPTAVGFVSTSATFTGGGGATRAVSGTGITAPVRPSVETMSATAIGTTTATLNARITSDGGAPITYREFDYRILGTSEWNIINGAPNGDYFSANLTGLIPNLIYEFQAWAMNSVGWGQGIVLTFRTLPLPTSVDEPEEPLFRIFPNPATNVLNIEWKGLGRAEIEIISAKGLVVLRKTIDSRSNQVDVSQLPEGIYILRLVSGNNAGRATFIRQGR